MTLREPYMTPRIEVIGRLADVTLGGPHSQADGCSGNVGNNGVVKDRCKPK